MFVGFEPVAGALVPFAYDWPMVGLSFLISACGAYVGLRWSRRVRLPGGHLDVDRLMCASVALGGGAVWSMHFIGMVAYQTPTHREFDLFMTLASLAVVMVLAGAGLAVASRPRGSRAGNVARGGVLTGLGVVAMHYTGMAAIRSNTRFDWNLSIIGLSVVIAVAASVVALWLATTVKTRARQLAAALAMGVAVCGMHYTGMLAGTMICTSPNYVPGLFAIEGDNIGYAVFGLTLITLMVILVVEATRSGAEAVAMTRPRDTA